MNLKLLLILFSCFLSFSSAFAVDYYVSALTGSDSNDGLTTTTAFRTIQKAADLTNPGDTVFIMNGTYSEVEMLYSIHRTVLYISRSGNADEYITYKNYPGHKPKISGENSIWNCVLIRANYIRFEGIELEGPNQSITYEEAKAMYDYYVEGENLDWYLIGTMNTNGLSLGVNVGSGPRTIFHHIEVKNCIVHNFPGGGIGGADFDYITIENNTVYNNSWYGMYATSGISVLHSQDIDTNTTDYKIIVRGNICYNNKTLIPWADRGYLSDGNGIIIDDNRKSQIAGGIPYTGKTLVENNISYNNGGSGIHAYSSNNVDIINNSAWNNGNVVGYPEIYGQDGTNVNIFNNIMYARTDGACNSNDAGTTYDYNIYFNGPASRQGPNDIVADPKFVRLAFDGTADFRLRSNSPAINSGSDTPGQFSLIDIEGVERPIGAKPDRGAYESEFLEPGIIPELTIWQNSEIKIINSGSYDFGDVFYDSPKTVSFIIENTGDADLIITDSQGITVDGDGFSLESDIITTIAPKNSTTFEVTLTTTSDIDYNGTISIESNDPYENPFHFLVSGKGKDPAKASQQITFNALPVKNLLDEDFTPEATSSSGLPVSLSSSAPTVATIVNGKIHIVDLGTTIITATQEGDENTHPAPAVSQSLSVIPVVNLAATNLVSNPTFDSGTTGWSFAYQNGGSASVASVDKNGYSSKVGKVTITSLGTTSSAYNVQFGTNVEVVAGKHYAILFKASTDADRMVDLFMLKNVSPWSTMFTQNNIALTTIPTTFGPFFYNSTTTESLAFRFLLGSSNHPVYIDDVEIREVLSSADDPDDPDDPDEATPRTDPLFERKQMTISPIWDYEGEIVIDGQADEGFWDLIEPMELKWDVTDAWFTNDTEEIDPEIAASGDYHVTWKVTMDNEFFYIFAEIVDDVLRSRSMHTAQAEWLNDNLELFFLFADTNVYMPDMALSDASQIRIFADIDEQTADTLTAAGWADGLITDPYQPMGYQSRTVETDNGYNMEARIPLGLIVPTNEEGEFGYYDDNDNFVPIVIREIEVFQFDIQAADRDDPDPEAGRKYLHQWSATWNRNWGYTEGYGRVTVGEPLATSTLEPVSKSELSIYPNPASHHLVIENLEGGNQISIVNLLGQEVYRASVKNSTTVMDISSLGNGIYLLQVTNHKGLRVAKKFIKI